MACRGTPQPFSGLNCIIRQKRLVRVGGETRCGVARLHEGHRRQTRALGGPARPSAGDAAASGAQILTSHRRRCTIVSPSSGLSRSSGLIRSDTDSGTCAVTVSARKKSQLRRCLGRSAWGPVESTWTQPVPMHCDPTPLTHTIKHPSVFKNKTQTLVAVRGLEI